MLCPAANNHFPAVFESVQALKMRCGDTLNWRVTRTVMGCLMSMATVPRAGPNHELGVDSAICSMRSPLVDEQLKLSALASNQTRLDARSRCDCPYTVMVHPIRCPTTRLVRSCPFGSILRDG